MNMITRLLVVMWWIGLGPTGMAQPVTTLDKRGHIPADSLFRLVYVPVEVPAGVAEIRVQQRYPSPGKNVLNLGIYGPEGHGVGKPAGFRGWSGGAKTEFFINAGEASTGYVPGKITPGTWYVLMYPSTILPEGIDWHLTLTLTPGADHPAFVAAPAVAVVNTRPGWYRGDLHLHTLHSDGKRTPAELVTEAKQAGLDFVVSTEHNTNSANLSWGRYASPQLLLINGEEVTTTAFGHWNAIGLHFRTLIDWRYTPRDGAVAASLAQVHADSGLAIINHPFYAPGGTNSFTLPVDHFDGIEVWNGQWDARDEHALRWWDELLRAGTSRLAVAASDSHTAAPSDNRLGSPHTVVQARGLSKAGILEGLRGRRAYLVAGTALSLTLTASAGAATAGIGDRLPAPARQNIQVFFSIRGAPGAVVTLYGNNGMIATETTADNQTFQRQWTVRPGSTTYLRVEVRTAQGEMLALTNPIWLQ